MKINSGKKDEKKSLDSYVPQDGPLSLREAMNRLFDESIWDPFDSFGGFWPETRGIIFPRVDISQDGKEVMVTADLPGIDPSDVEIEVDEDSLVISGQMKREEKEEQKDYYHMEREYGEFRRVLPLPARVRAEQAEAQVKDGVLTVILPRSKESKKQKVKVKK